MHEAQSIFPTARSSILYANPLSPFDLVRSSSRFQRVWQRPLVWLVRHPIYTCNLRHQHSFIHNDCIDVSGAFHTTCLHNLSSTAWCPGRHGRCHIGFGSACLPEIASAIRRRFACIRRGTSPLKYHRTRYIVRLCAGATITCILLLVKRVLRTLHATKNSYDMATDVHVQNHAPFSLDNVMGAILAHDRMRYSPVLRAASQPRNDNAAITTGACFVHLARSGGA
jgi:hypothetical protein